MFSGMIEEQGVVTDVRRRENLFVLKVRARKILKGVKIGDSVAVDGVCLTVTSKQKNSLSFDVMAETLRATTLKFLKVASKMNLERSFKMGDRLGGHFVSGHVDGVERVNSVIKKRNYVELVISLNKALRCYVVVKGSVCVNGVSLTVGRLQKGRFSVYLIAHTLCVTNLGTLRTGDTVNIETDILAKYFFSHVDTSGRSKG